MHTDTARVKLLVAIVLCLVAAHFRFTAVLNTTIDGPIRGDARDYLFYAYNLQTHGVYSRDDAGLNAKPKPDSLRSPGYPAFVMLFLDPDDVSQTLVRVGLVQAALSTITVLLSFGLFLRFLPLGLAAATGGLTAISPHLINANVYLLTESLFTFFVVLHLWLLPLARNRHRAGLWLLAGTILAIATLIRPTTQFFILVLWCWLALDNSGTAKARIRAALCLALPVVLIYSAWGIRNEQALGKWSDPTQAAIFVQHGMYIDLKFDGRDETFGYPYRFDPVNDAMYGKLDEVLAEWRRRVAAAPLKYAYWYTLGKPWMLFRWDLTESVGDSFVYAPTRTPYTDRYEFVWSHSVAKVAHLPAVIMSLLMVLTVLVFRQARSPINLLMALTICYFISVHIVGGPFPRYSIPIRPLTYGLAGLCMYWCYQKLCQQRVLARWQ